MKNFCVIIGLLALSLLVVSCTQNGAVAGEAVRGRTCPTACALDSQVTALESRIAALESSTMSEVARLEARINNLHDVTNNLRSETVRLEARIDNLRGE